MKLVDAVDGWDDEANAMAYMQFTRDYPMYRESSRYLARRANLADAERAVDLCGGAGVTAAAMLAEMPASGQLVSVDSSAAMQAAGHSMAHDPRVTWVTCRAEDIASHVRPPVDSVVCNSAMWKTQTKLTFPACYHLLRPGGRLVFSVAGEFADLPAYTVTDELIDQIAQADYGYRPDPAAHQATALLTAEACTTQLDAAGFTDIDCQPIVQWQTLAERRAWLSIPLFAQPPGQLTHAQRMEILERVFAGLDLTIKAPSTWLVVTAVRPE